MKKFFLCCTVVVASAAYVAYQYFGGGGGASAATTQTTAAAVAPPTAQQPAVQTSAPAVSVSPTQGAGSPPAAPASTPTPAPPPVSKPQGQYVDGTYTGSGADAYYGTVQVQATISGGRITGVTFLQYPNDRSTSRYINSQAMPQLIQEAIAAQSANVSGVSGASDTSAAFKESLGSALAQAKNS